MNLFNHLSTELTRTPVTLEMLNMYNTTEKYCTLTNSANNLKKTTTHNENNIPQIFHK